MKSPLIFTRFDKGEIVGKLEKTPEGYIRTVARVTRTGVFSYRNTDGSARRELRHPDEVFSADSLASLKMIPITNNHPDSRLVTADTAKALSIGFTGENIQPDGKFLMVPITITTADGVAAVENGRKELSLGYEVNLENTPGEYNNDRFDCIQRCIRYNHLAIVDRGRAGPEVSIHMDGEEIEQPTTNTIHKEIGMKIVLDGIEYEGAPEIIKALEKANVALHAANGRIDAMTKDVEVLKANADTANDQLKVLQTRNIDGEIAEAVKARIALEGTARGIVVKDMAEKLPSMTDAEIRAAVITTVFPTAKLDGASKDYLQARFDAAVELKTSPASSDTAAAQREAVLARKNVDGCGAGEKPNSEASRKKYMDEMQNAWKSSNAETPKKK